MSIYRTVHTSIRSFEQEQKFIPCLFLLLFKTGLPAPSKIFSYSFSLLLPVWVPKEPYIISKHTYIKLSTAMFWLNVNIYAILLSIFIRFWWYSKCSKRLGDQVAWFEIKSGNLYKFGRLKKKLQETESGTDVIYKSRDMKDILTNHSWLEVIIKKDFRDS